MQILAGLGLLSTYPLLIRARRGLQGTTLLPAWRWTLAGTTAWMTLTALCAVPGVIEEGTADLFGYAVSVLMLCPPIAVLGARRPTVRVWTWFVLLPLCLVLGWPAAASWSAASDANLVVETPVLVGYTVVVIMGAGNYVGTRFSLPALLYGVALILMTLSVTSLEFAAGWPGETWRSLAALLFACAAWIAARQARPVSSAAVPLDRLWLQFRDLFGIVWSKRILERLNGMLAKSGVAARLHVQGFEFNAENSLKPAEETLRDVELP